MQSSHPDADEWFGPQFLERRSESPDGLGRFRENARNVVKLIFKRPTPNPIPTVNFEDVLTQKALESLFHESMEISAPEKAQSTEAKLTERIDALFSLDVNALDAELDRLTWDSRFQSADFLAFAKNEGLPSDLRGIAAKLFVQSLYPIQAVQRGYTGAEPAFALDDAALTSIRELAQTGPRLVCLGILEGLERASARSMIREFANHDDPVVKKNALELLDDL